MRRESSTVIALVGRVSLGLMTALAESGNVAVARAAEPSGTAGSGRSIRPAVRARPAGIDASAAAAEPPVRAGWEQGALAMRAAARHRATYVVVANDPLAGVASAWREMWSVAAGPGAAAAFEEQAAETLAAWRSKQFELPDYYLVVVAAQHLTIGADLYLGPLRAARPRRITVAAVVDTAPDPDGLAVTASLLDTLRSLEHGPWWPPLDELLEAARRFHAGGLAETQRARYS
ncbi:MAG: hypothetical protein ACRDOK_16475 [Streptosporangiaceae bacterium]